MPKYKIVISRGCTAFYTEVNGKIVGCEYEPSRLTESETEELVQYLASKLSESIRCGEVSLDSLIELFPYADEEYDNTVCESCGDTVTRTIYEL